MTPEDKSKRIWEWEDIFAIHFGFRGVWCYTSWKKLANKLIIFYPKKETLKLLDDIESIRWCSPKYISLLRKELEKAKTWQ